MDDLIKLGEEEGVKMQQGKAEKDDIDVRVKDADGNDLTEMLSDKKFDELGLSEDMIRLIYNHGWDVPSKIQMQSLPIILGHTTGICLIIVEILLSIVEILLSLCVCSFLSCCSRKSV